MDKIKDYAIIGNGRSAALISKEGSLDWLCWPRYDSPSLFAGILDKDIGGSWKIIPSSIQKIERQYIENTNVLETHFVTETGKISLIDFMPAFEEENSLQPLHEIIRRVQCEKGEVEFTVHFDPRSNFGKEKPTLIDKKPFGYQFSIGRGLITFQSSVELGTKIKLKEGERADFSLSYNDESPAVIPPLGKLISQKKEATVDLWKKWAGQISYKGPYQKEVIRSALVLKLLAFSPSGTFVAALTTSLPQKIGGDFNWDYRFCWLRDAAFTVKALFGLGYQEDAVAFVSWLLHSTRLTRPKLRVLYDMYGNDIENDVEIPHLKGFAHSYPCRKGNGVRQFFELDVYGEVIEAVTYFVRSGGDLDRETQKMVAQFGKFVCENWEKSDTGIWEKMDQKHYTHSRLMCWVALDRLLEMAEKGKIKNLPIDEIKKHHQKIRKTIEETSWNEKLKTYVKSLEEPEVDATLYLMPLYGFNQHSSLKMNQTFQKLEEKLIPAPGLVYRYEKSSEEGEGAFGLCSYWRIEYLAQAGLLHKAHEAFKQMLDYGNDLGLFSEEMDPKTKDALGNFPQAFTHVGLINAALTLEKIQNLG